MYSELVESFKRTAIVLDSTEEFWVEGLSSTPDFSQWWDGAKKMFSESSEVKRKYYSEKAYLNYGIPNVYFYAISDKRVLAT